MSLDETLHAIVVVIMIVLAFRQPTLGLTTAYAGFGVGYLGLLLNISGWFK